MEIELINPHNTKKRKFTCMLCGISYNKKEYKLLYDAKKIVFFDFPAKNKVIRLCHDC